MDTNFKIHYNLLHKQKKISQDILKATNEDKLIAQIFLNRGFEDEHIIREMIDPTLYNPTVPSDFPNIYEAVDIILEAAKLGEKICVYGDYDVDGVTSVAVLVKCIETFTGNVVYHVPDRFKEGYGMNIDVIHRLYKEEVKLIITCDCGITNLEEIRLAKSLGINVIVTDHHHIPDVLVNADVILNPKLLPKDHRARNISGCGMAYFLSVAILEKLGMDDIKENVLNLVCLSTISDVVELVGENRYLLQKGLPQLINPSNEQVGIKELMKLIEKRETACNDEQDIAFRVAPRINAAGRMETAEIAVELLISKDIHVAAKLAQKLDLLNIDRKRVQQEIVDQAIQMAKQSSATKSIIVLFNGFWHHGIVGIAAGKVCEYYNRPVILMCFKDDQHTVVGSARSVDGVDIYQLIKQCSQFLIKFGGHSKAAGLSLKTENLENFTQQIESIAQRKLTLNQDLCLDIDAELRICDIDQELYDRVKAIGPFGEGFRAPLFLSRNVKVKTDKKTNKNHHIMTISDDNGFTIPAIQWFGDDKDYSGKMVDLVYCLVQNRCFIELNVRYVIEVHESERPRKFNGKIVDMRNFQVEDILNRYKDWAMFYEGLDSACPIQNPINRYNIRKERNLVFLSAPTNTTIFREIVFSVNPAVIVLNFGITVDFSVSNFISRLLGIIKYVIVNCQGYILLNELIIKMSVEENVIVSALKYLEQKGKICFSISNNKCVHFQKNLICSRYIDKYLERCLMDALIEKEAYQRSLRNLEIERLLEYFI